MERFVKKKKTEVETQYLEIPRWFINILGLLLMNTLIFDLMIIPFLPEVRWLRNDFETVLIILCIFGIILLTLKNIKEKQQKGKFVKRKEAINMIGSIS